MPVAMGFDTLTVKVVNVYATSFNRINVINTGLIKDAGLTEISEFQ